MSLGCVSKSLFWGAPLTNVHRFLLCIQMWCFREVLVKKCGWVCWDKFFFSALICWLLEPATGNMPGIYMSCTRDTNDNGKRQEQLWYDRQEASCLRIPTWLSHPQNPSWAIDVEFVRDETCAFLYVEVSEIGGSPLRMIYNEKSLFKWMILGVPLF